MSDYDDDYDEDLGDGQGSNAVRELRKANKAKEAQLKKLSDELAAMRAAVRDRSVKDALTAKGLPEKIARFIPPEATTSEDVEAWLAENGDVFGVTPPAEKADHEQPPAPELSALNRISEVQSSGQPFTNDPDQMRALINSAASPEALNELLFGNKAGPQAI